ncbi:hypothetical protein QC760_007583 [Botrytis cinerea]
MGDQKMIQRCQLSSAANCFLNSCFVQDNNKSFGRDHPQAPYYAGRNWKSAMSAATELDEHRKMTIQEYQRVRVQIEDSINRIDLCHKKAEKVKLELKEKEPVQRGSTGALSARAHLQTPLVLNSTSDSFPIELPRLAENSHLSEHTGSLELPLHRKSKARSALHLRTQRTRIVATVTNERGAPRFSAEYYNKCVSHYEFPNPDSPSPNGRLFNALFLFLSDAMPAPLTEIQAKILNGTEEERKEAKNEISEMNTRHQRELTKRKMIIRAQMSAMKAQGVAAHLLEFKTTDPFLKTVSQFEEIKERGGEDYLRIKHHLSAVPKYVAYEFRNERQIGTGLWNAIGPGNGVKRARPGSMWREHDPRGMHSSLRMVSNASGDFQEEYVTKASSGPPTSIHPVDDLPVPLEEELDTEESESAYYDSDSDDSDSDDSDSDDSDSDDSDSDESDSDDSDEDSEDYDSGGDELVHCMSEEDYWNDFNNRYE